MTVCVVLQRELSWDPWIVRAAFTSVDKAQEWVDEWSREERSGTFVIEEVALDPFGWPGLSTTVGGTE